MLDKIRNKIKIIRIETLLWIIFTLRQKKIILEMTNKYLFRTNIHIITKKIYKIERKIMFMISYDKWFKLTKYEIKVIEHQIDVHDYIYGIIIRNFDDGDKEKWIYI